ncbi:hypothetical protein ACFY36_42445 [Actinoplanes sp. NPDC000266]
MPMLILVSNHRATLRSAAVTFEFNPGPGPAMWPAGPPAPQRHAHRSPRPRWLAPAAVVAGAAVLFGSGWFGGISYASGTPTTTGGVAGVITDVVSGRSAGVALLQEAQDTCDSTHTGTEIADNGSTLTVDGTGEEDYSGIAYAGVECVFGVLQVPEAVKEHVAQTRALDGRQQDTWGSFSASWGYHPDSGLDMIVRVV